MAFKVTRKMVMLSFVLSTMGSVLISVVLAGRIVEGNWPQAGINFLILLVVGGFAIYNWFQLGRIGYESDDHRSRD
jgi:hypothetical protein